MLLIKSLYGRWEGQNFKGLSGKFVLGVLILVNETDERVVYSESKKYSQGVTDEIAAEPGEAICYVQPGAEYGEVAVGLIPNLVRWLGYYFYDPHLTNLVSVADGDIAIYGVPVTPKVMKSYSLASKKALLSKIGRKVLSSSQRQMVESRLMGSS
jgi:hypothetical protein